MLKYKLKCKFKSPKHKWMVYHGVFKGKYASQTWSLREDIDTLVFGCWLMNRVIYLKLRQKLSLLQAKQINFFFSQNGGQV